MPSKEYLLSVLEKAKSYLPVWLYNEIHVAARARAGGLSRNRQAIPNFLEKLSLVQMTPNQLKDAPDEEIRQAWLKLHQWYSTARRKGEAVEDFVNAGVWVMSEMRRRGFRVDESTGFAGEIARLKGAVTKSADERFKLYDLPQDLMVVQNIASIVGSSAREGEDSPGDVDLLIRAKRDADGDNFLVQAENVWLPIRNVIDPLRTGAIHWIDNPQGPHGDNIPLYDLVLRRRPLFKREVVKSLTESPVRIDLGCGDRKPEGFVGIDLKEGADIVHDLNLGIPLPDESVDVMRASDVLGFLVDKSRVMAEIHRTLKPGGRFEFAIPPNGDDYQTQWDRPSFAFWTDPELIEDRPLFEVESFADIYEGTQPIMLGCLRKPKFKVVKQTEFKPGDRFIPARPRVLGFVDSPANETRQLWQWANQRIPVGVEPMFKGLRVVIEKAGNKASLWFDKKREENRLADFPSIADLIRRIDHDFTVEGTLAITRGERHLPQAEVSKLTGGRLNLDPGDSLVVYLGDLLYHQEDYTGKTFEERRDELDRFFGMHLKASEGFKISPVKWVNSEEELADITRTINDNEGATGALVKASGAAYPLDGPSPDIRQIPKPVTKEISLESRLMAAAVGVEVLKQGEEGSETRGATADRKWRERWGELLPASGKGRFVYHHHWRGLTEDEAKSLDDKALLRTDHSLHSDLRFEGNGGLWGFSVFLGRAEENLKAGGDRLASTEDKSLQGAWKLQQPKEWLDVGKGKPHIVEPGGPGSTSSSFSKFFAHDSGTYEMGYAKESFFEIFLKGDKLKGRVTFQRASIDGRTVWLVNRPKDQTPFIDKADRDKEIKDQKTKGRKWIYWAKPGTRPELIDLAKAEVKKSDDSKQKIEVKVSVIKSDEDQRLVYGEVLVPEVKDSQGEIISAEEIQKTAHGYLEKSRVVGIRHRRQASAKVVESYLAPTDLDIDGHKIKKGTWILVVRIDDPETWADIKAGLFNGYSVGGFALHA